MDTHINLVRTTGLLLLQHVGFMLVVEELDDGLPGIAVVDIISEARGINDGQANCRQITLAQAWSLEMYHYP